MSLVEAREADFHDKWAESTDPEKVAVLEAFTSHGCPENRLILKWLGSVQGKKILELGAGLGEASIYFSMLGAEVTATDISPKMLENIQALGRRFNTKISTQVCSATDLSPFPDESLEIVYAANLLHHVEVEKCIIEVYRKLKPGGCAYFWDPLDYNPVINIYRKMATQVRTDDEHPLKSKDLALIKSTFSKVTFQFVWLSALVIFLKYFLWDRFHPNEVRYWKKVVEDGASENHWLRHLHRIDAWLFLWIPPLRLLAWNVVIRAEK